MTDSLHMRISTLLNKRENEHVEFKKAGGSFSYDEVVRYCCALANEHGGILVLGITPDIPRTVTGTKVFENTEEIKHRLLVDLHIRVDIEDVDFEGRRVLVFTVFSRPIGMPIHYKGAYWMRSGESLVPMSADHLGRIFAEGEPDFSAHICRAATMEDLSPDAIARFVRLWNKKSGRPETLPNSTRQFLEDAELTRNGAITYAALILLGTRSALGRHIAQSELVFEYRSSENQIRYAQRQEFREGFFLWYDHIWDLVSLRNDLQHYEEGLFVWDIPTFSEIAIRELILNAVAHRDYRFAGSIFVRQNPQIIEIVSPGGFPEGISEENIIDRQAPRNRRIAEVLSRCGLVERSGQGMNTVYRTCLMEGKRIPDFSGTDQYQVSVRLDGSIPDERFLRFLERVGKETHYSLALQDLMAIDAIHWEKTIPETVKDRINLLLSAGIIERASRGKFILSRRFYEELGAKGIYTRRKGLDRDEKKALLLKHICENESSGGTMTEFQQVLPSLSRSQIQVLLRELKSGKKIALKGLKKGARWFPF